MNKKKRKERVPVVTVDHENQTLSTGVVMSPERTNLILTSNILKGKKRDGIK
jgi:hypothetical protein